MNRAEWVESGARAYLLRLTGSDTDLAERIDTWDRGVAEAIIAAVEPLIRAQTAADILAQTIDLTADTWVDGDLTVDGHTYRLTKTLARVINAVRYADAAIVRGKS